ncbi:MAG: tyrosine-type recombinase/integrase [Anaerorhabdus sp.]|uniref:tyrosine-type recombinase/integrase n=1 Tax=Anaerorhabdus sp. TaxID=1872524 RepID=UPI002FCAB05D
MAVRKEKDKTYTLDFYYVDKISGVRKRFKKRGFKTVREAKEWQSNNRIDVELPTHEKLIFYFEKYSQSLECNNETKKGNKQVLKKYASDLLEMEYYKISKPMLLDWRNQLNNTKLSTKTKNRIIGLIKAIFRYANKIYDLNDTSVILDRYKKPLDEIKEYSVWEVDEFNKFINCVDSYACKAYFTLLYYTGMRRSEAKALLKSDISKDMKVTINKSMRHGADSVKKPKTKGSIRTIDIDKDTYAILSTLIDSEGQYLFGDLEPVGASTFERAFQEGIKTSGVKKIRMHDLRHSHATLLINNGADIVAVSKRLGHSDINMTLGIYTHLLERKNVELIKIIDKMHKKVKSSAKVVPKNNKTL